MTFRLLVLLVVVALLGACAAPSSTVIRSDEPAVEPAIPPATPDAQPTDGRCANCGTVERVERVAAAAASQGNAAQSDAQGGLVGNALGNSNSAPATAGFEVTVRLDNGSTVIVRQRALGGVRQGQRVEIIDGRAQPVLINPAAE